MKAEIICKVIEDKQSAISTGNVVTTKLEFKGEIMNDDKSSSADISISIKGPPGYLKEIMNEINILNLNETTIMTIDKNKTGRLVQKTLAEEPE